MSTAGTSPQAPEDHTDIVLPDGSLPVAEADAAATPEEPGYHDAKKAYLRRLRLVEGQVRGIARMVEEDTYCIDVLTQLSAVGKALESLSVALADDHIHHCVHHAASSGDQAEIDAKLDEVMTVVKRLLR